MSKSSGGIGLPSVLFRRRLASLVCCLWVVAVTGTAFAQVVSPGKLSRAHTEVEGSQNCTKCHAHRGRVEPKRCLSCHEALSDRATNHKGYHASLVGSRCGKCHHEHRGLGFDIVRWPSGGIDTFRHASTGFVLKDAHQKEACRECHKPEFQVAAKVRKFDRKRRKKTFLGLGTACKNCHKDEHEGTLGEKCEKCHGQRSFENPPFFDHEKSNFPLRGEHRDLRCSKCHLQRPGGKSAVLYKGIKFEQCSSCHEDQHSGVMTARVSGHAKAKTCDSCHSEQGWKKVRYRKIEHSPKHLALIGGHAQPKCAKCHQRGLDKMPAASCKTCHQDTHKGRFGKKCVQCHVSGSWSAKIRAQKSVSLSLLDSAKRLGISRKQVAKVGFHEQTDFALRGQHIKVACSRCHSPKRRAFKRRFQNVAHDSCASCHKDEHEKTFGKTACKECHSPDGWTLTSFDAKRHQDTSMPLDGAHEGVACDSCHAKKRGAKKRFRYKSTSCSSCHQDSHDGQFSEAKDAKHPIRACESCHSTRGFTQVYFEHEQVGFPLAGVHQSTACASCHKRDPEGIIQFRGLSQDCASCHEDSQHQGQFQIQGAPRSCGECHGQAGFEIKGFDHNAKTEEVLVGAHRKVACKKCHERVKLNGGRRVALYRLGDRDCVDCHAPEHEDRSKGWKTMKSPTLLDTGLGKLIDKSLGTSLVRSKREVKIEDCKSCHTPRSWEGYRNASAFDHRIVGFTLRGQHASVQCSECHAPGKTLSKDCSNCHEDRHRGRMGMQCAECHQETSWRATDIRDRHRLTRLPLTGRHALTDCIDCHPNDRQSQYRAIPVTCVGCHAKQYTAPTTHPNHALNGFTTECEDCHRPYGWSPAYFAHATFRLDGAHRLLSCSQCHSKSPLPNTCAGCHESNRAGVTLPSHRDRSVFGDCESCHSQTSWRPANFSRHESSFPIASGEHSAFTCAQCHLNPTDARAFSCVTGCHPVSFTAGQHNEVPMYVYESRACLDCHPQGDE